MAQGESQGQSGATTDWQKKAEDLEKQLRGLSAERDQFRQKSQAWEKLGQEAGDVIAYDPQTGLPVGFNVGETNPNATISTPQNATGKHPLSGFLGEADYSPVDGYYDTRYVPRQQYLKDLQDTAARAYQAARGDLMVFRQLDKTLSQKDYADLSKYDSDWSKRTADILKQNGWGRSLDGADSWEKWQYASPEALRVAADIAMAQMHREQQAQSASNQQAVEAQKAASLVAGTVGAGGGTTPSTDKWKEMLDKQDDVAFNQMVKDDAKANLERQMSAPL